MADLIDRDALEAKIRENSMRIRFFDPSVNVILHLIRYAPAVNRWISCTERLPENFVWCLVCMSDRNIRIGKWNGEYDEQGVWWVSHSTGGKLYRIKNVPYWMPLPEPPESEENSDE